MVKIRRAVTLALMISLVFLAGCSGSEKLEEDFELWRESFLAVEEHEITADVTYSSSDDRVCEYSLRYISSEDGETIEVLSPELITGVSARIENGESELTFDGAILETGSGVTEGISPMTALPVFMDFIREGHVENLGREKMEDVEVLVTELELADGEKMTLWQAGAEMEPVFAAVRKENSVILKINISQIK